MNVIDYRVEREQSAQNIIQFAKLKKLSAKYAPYRDVFKHREREYNYIF